MTFRSITLLAILVSTVATGCSRFRGITRKDYAQYRDPFLTSPESHASANDRSSDSAGRVSLGDLGEGSNTASIRPAVADYSQANAAQTASLSENLPSQRPINRSMGNRHPGPQLSDFMNTANSSVRSARTAASEASQTLNGFSGEVRAAAESATRTPVDVDPGFAEWASKQKEEWTDQTTQQVGHIVDQSKRQVIQANDKLVEEVDRMQQQLTAPIFDDEPAVPLIRNEQPAAQSVESSTPAFSNETANPFAEFETPAPKPEAQPSSTVTTEEPSAMFPEQPVNDKAATLDSTFEFDAGWKPSHLSRP